MSTKREQSFGEQAARFSLYAPFTAIVIGLFANGSREPSVAIALFCINVLLVLAGLSLGIVALSSMRRYGRQRILRRAIAGVFFNGVVVTVLILAFLPLVLAGQLKGQLAGRWSMPVASDQLAGVVSLTLNKDGSFAFESARNGAASASLSGTWVLTRDRVLGINIKHVTQGDPIMVGKRIGLGTVRSIDDEQMVLQTDQGQEVYTRTH